MRWRFAESRLPGEASARDAVIALIDRWWLEFSNRAAELDAMFAGRDAFDLPAWMEDYLQSIDGRLMWEYGPAVQGIGHRLVITPEVHYHLAPLVQEILQRAPNLQGWEFYPGRLPESLETAEQNVNARTGGTLRDVAVAVSASDHHLIDLIFQSPSPSATEDAFVGTELLLGEEILNSWIGAISVAPPRRRRFGGLGAGGSKAKDFFPVADLHARVAQERDRIRALLPDGAHMSWVDDAEVSLFQVQAQEADNYPAKVDLITGIASNPALWQATLADRFDSIRFSRTGETFCYVKIDGQDPLTGSEFDDRGEIEDALDETLRAAQLGCVIGAGTGLRHSYIDVALTELDAGLAAIRERLRVGRLPRQTWIQFFDCRWRDEWIGVYDDTPEPPLERP